MDLKARLLKLSKTNGGEPWIPLYVVVDGGDGDVMDGYLNKEVAEKEAEDLQDCYPFMKVEETSIGVDELLNLINSVEEPS